MIWYIKETYEAATDVMWCDVMQFTPIKMQCDSISIRKSSKSLSFGPSTLKRNPRVFKLKWGLQRCLSCWGQKPLE